jgi:hypothetical protein
VCSNIIIIINGLDIMVTLNGIYLNIAKLYVRYLLNILCPYYKFIQTILLYFFKLLQMKFIIIIIYLC